MSKNKSLVSALSGRYSTINIENNKKRKVICGKVLRETEKQYLIEDRNTGIVSRVNKTSIKSIKSGKNNFQFS